MELKMAVVTPIMKKGDTKETRQEYNLFQQTVEKFLGFFLQVKKGN